ncbi:MAG: hypothetical protein SCK57_12555 [Bacillota bacterium]|nr:hypothetical protein [Bacillota bacterium]MDW7678483.1 hypothetical protein [Bacillota bacterium]
MDKKQVYEGQYLPDIIRWGRITNVLGLLLSFGPALVLAVYFRIVPPVSAIITGFISIASAVGVLWFLEPISYFPIVGVAGTYMAFLTGNISNLRIPSAAIAQSVAKVDPGTEEGSIIATLGMAVSVIVNIVILALGVLAGTTLLANLPPAALQALNYLLPALFGALFIQFTLNKPKLAPIAITIALFATLMVRRGIFPFYLPTLVSVFGTMFIGIALYKKKLL